MGRAEYFGCRFEQIHPVTQLRDEGRRRLHQIWTGAFCGNR